MPDMPLLWATPEWNERRAEQLISAIYRYYQHGTQINVEWVEELVDVVKAINEKRPRGY